MTGQTSPGSAQPPAQTAPAPPPVLRLEHLHHRFGRGPSVVQALDDVSLTLAAGTWTAIMGPSGSGKSTLLHCAGGLLRPDAGSIMLGQADLARASERFLTRLRRDTLGFVFQSSNLVESLTARQNLQLPLRLAGRVADAASVDRALARVGLTGRAGHRPTELSGGQQQRVAIARALVIQPSLLLADEPTGALDSTSAAQVLDLLGELVRSGQTIAMVTHDPAVAARAHRVVMLRDGRIRGILPGGDAARIAAALTALENGAAA